MTIDGNEGPKKKHQRYVNLCEPLLTAFYKCSAPPVLLNSHIFIAGPEAVSRNEHFVEEDPLQNNYDQENYLDNCG